MYTTSAQLLTVHGFLRRHPPPREAPRRAELLALRPTPSGLDGDFMSADVLWMLNEDARTAVGSSRYFFFLVFFFFCAFAKRAVCFGATGEWLLAVVLSIPFTVTPHNPLPVFFFSFFFFLLISDSARGTGEEMLWVFFFDFSYFSALVFSFFFFLVGDLDSPGLVLMWAAVATVTDARDKARAPAFGQGHQRIVDSSALFTQSLFLSLSLSFFLSYIQPPSVFLSLLLHTPTVIFFSVLASPLMVSFSLQSQASMSFSKKKRVMQSIQLWSFHTESIFLFCSRSVWTVTNAWACWTWTRGVPHNSMGGDY